MTVERSRIYTDFKELLKQYGLSQEFSYAVKRELDEIPDEIPEEELRRRKDLSNLTIVTIDGEDAKDLDDAVSIEKTKEGNYRLGVHIADVSYYVKENSEIDREAYNRGTSVYLVDKVVPMLPKSFQTSCAALTRKKRLTISCFMDINKTEP